jgi:UPF0716 protein FxsA
MRAAIVIGALLVLEIAVFVSVGPVLGVVGVLAAVALGMVAGVLLLRSVGRTTLAALRRVALDPRSLPHPLSEVTEGVVVVIAALCLLMPGLVTGAIGLLLLLPPVRRAVGAGLMRAVDRNTPPASRQTQVVEGEYVDITASSDRAGREPRDRRFSQIERD